jgi:transposase
VRVGMEATGYSRWFERLLAELGFEVWIGDPAEIKTRRVKKQKTDRKDAQLLLRLMREDNFPQIWVPSPENRDLRQLVWRRHRLVERRTRIMNQLQALAATRIDLSSTLQSPFSCRCLVRGKILHGTKRTNVHPRPKNQSDAPSGK